MSLLPRIDVCELVDIEFDIDQLRPAADDPLDHMVTLPAEVVDQLRRDAIAGRRAGVLDLTESTNKKCPAAAGTARGNDQEGTS